MDPLSLLREHHMGNKPVMLQGDQIVFGTLRIPRDTPTAYRSQAGGTQAAQGGFYAIDQLWFFLQNSKLSHAQYLMACNKTRIKAVSLPDKRDLLAYLSGQTDHSAAIDLANAPLMGDLIDSTADQPSHKRHRSADGPRDALSEQQAQELVAQARKIVEAALDGPALIAVQPVADDGAAAAGAPAAEPSAGASRSRAQPGKRPAPMPTGAALDALIRSDLPDVELILERELRGASRSSLLLAPSKKVFAPRVEQILATLRAQASRAPTPRAPMPPSAVAAGARSGSGSKGGAGKGGAPAGVQPPPLLIVVPAALNCAINMWNVADFLTRGV